ncbi:UDP-galactose transmembrane transporter [Aureococcus anophagefferens]|nr:UDP-galactose transmembrane transporter [Aureococcus anophagefferens]
MSGGGDASEQLTPADGRKYWVRLAISFFGIMFSFILYGIAMEYATTGGRKLHELSLILVTSTLYTTTAYVGKTLRGEQPTTVPTYKLFFVLAKSCKPIPVMIMGAFLGKRYPSRSTSTSSSSPLRCLFMLGGSATKPGDDEKAA